MLIDKYRATVRINGNNILPIYCLADEVPVLKGIWKEENLVLGDVVGKAEIDEHTEAARLIAKFGRKAVEDVYQKDAIGLADKLDLLKEPVKRRAATAAK